MTVVAQAAVRRDIGVFEWLFDTTSWTGRDGILASLGDTAALCAVVMAVAIVATVPLAAWLSHSRRGELSVSWLVTLSRAVPTFAVAGLLVPISLRRGWGFEPWPIFIALLLLALPPIFLNTYTAIRQVDPGEVDAARAMGFSERNILFKVELALASIIQRLQLAPSRIFKYLGPSNLALANRRRNAQRHDFLGQASHVQASHHDHDAQLAVAFCQFVCFVCLRREG